MAPIKYKKKVADYALTLRGFILQKQKPKPEPGLYSKISLHKDTLIKIANIDCIFKESAKAKA